MSLPGSDFYIPEPEEGWTFNKATDEDRAKYGEHVVVAHYNPALGFDDDHEEWTLIIRDYRDKLPSEREFNWFACGFLAAVVVIIITLLMVIAN